MHLVAPEVGMLGSAPIVAGTISLALGAALASHIRGDRRVTVSFFGDGATGEGVFYEALNFAALRKLPIIFACENNFYSTHLSIRECRPATPIAETGRAFGVASECIDGNDVLAVHDAAKRAVRRCRSGRGPVLMELHTYRMRGHVGPDDNIQGTHQDIRPEAEIRAWRRKDPIRGLEKILLAEGILTRAEIRTIHRELEQEVAEAKQFAEQSPRPDGEEVARYVFR
jgi:TPP-dependent pyruvate/acetoin dehydrogenase alpha subunit